MERLRLLKENAEGTYKTKHAEAARLDDGLLDRWQGVRVGTWVMLTFRSKKYCISNSRFVLEYSKCVLV